MSHVLSAYPVLDNRYNFARFPVAKGIKIDPLKYATDISGPTSSPLPAGRRWRMQAKR